MKDENDYIRTKLDKVSKIITREKTLSKRNPSSCKITRLWHFTVR